MGIFFQQIILTSSSSKKILYAVRFRKKERKFLKLKKLISFLFLLISKVFFFGGIFDFSRADTRTDWKYVVPVVVVVLLMRLYYPRIFFSLLLRKRQCFIPRFQSPRPLQAAQAAVYILEKDQQTNILLAYYYLCSTKGIVEFPPHNLLTIYASIDLSRNQLLKT